jgi:hypothetical protein
VKRHVTRRQVGWFGAVTLLLLVLSIYGGAWLLERALMVPVNAYIRSRTLAFLQEKNVEGLIITFPKLDLSLLRRQLVINDLKIRYDNKDSTRYERFQATVPRITLTGVDLGDVIWHRHLRLDAVRLSSPVLSRLRETADTGRKRAPTPAPTAKEDEDKVVPDSLAAQIPALDSVVYNLVSSWLPDDIRNARIELVRADDATIVSTVRKGNQVSRDSSANLSLRIQGIQLDSNERRVFESARLSAASLFHLTTGLRDSLRIDSLVLQLNPHDTTLTFTSLRTIPADSGNALFLGGFKRGHHGRTFSLDTAAYGPLKNDSAFFARPIRRTRVRLSLKGVKGSGVDAAALPRGQAVVQRVVIDSLRIDALADTRADPHPRPRELWPQVLAKTAWRLAIDTVRLEHGYVHYGELKPNRPEPAVVWFSNIVATISGLGNHPDSTKVSTPAVLLAKGQFMDQASLEARLEIPIVPDRFDMKVEGKAGGMQAAALNRFLLTAMGVRVTEGKAQGATFNYRVTNSTAKGTITVVYDSLSVEIVDRTTRKKGLDEKLKTFMANTFMVRGSNLPDEKGKLDPATISYRYKLGETFWGGIWRSLRSGLTKTIKK